MCSWLVLVTRVAVAAAAEEGPLDGVAEVLAACAAGCWIRHAGRLDDAMRCDVAEWVVLRVHGSGRRRAGCEVVSDDARGALWHRADRADERKKTLVYATRAFWLPGSLFEDELELGNHFQLGYRYCEGGCYE
ncbi:hypothetical protein F4780DRAFT_728995 [Xylariomycetidae sp. FL0641]|nr:hypothetical protein F4780DRAFT_728995 [Xylariomycetidae sp. FL0641]